MADTRRIYNRYKDAGYLSVPGFYNTEGRDCRCKICGWENRSATAGICPNCDFRYTKACKADKKIAGVLPVRALWREEWQVFEAIAKQIANGESPFATVEEYVEECQDHIAEIKKQREATQTSEQQRDAILYGQ